MFVYDITAVRYAFAGIVAITAGFGTLRLIIPLFLRSIADIIQR